MSITIDPKLKVQLGGFYAASKETSEFCQASITLVAALPDGPSWFAPVQQTVTNVQVNAYQWLHQICPTCNQDFPGTLIQCAATFNKQATTILNTLNQIPAAGPSAAQKHTISTSFSTIQASIAGISTMVSQMKKDIQGWSSNIQGNQNDVAAAISTVESKLANGKKWIDQLKTVITPGFVKSSTLGPCRAIVSINETIKTSITSIGADQEVIIVVLSDSILKQIQSNIQGASASIVGVLNLWTTLQTKITSVVSDLNSAQGDDYVTFLENADLSTAKDQWGQLAKFVQQQWNPTGNNPINPNKNQNFVMLDYTRSGKWTDPDTSTDWVYYGDTEHNSWFYIVPNPSYVLESAATPVFKLVTYDTSDPSTNGSGFLHMETELSVPTAIQSKVETAIKAKYPDAGSNIIFNTLDFNPGTEVTMDIPTATGTLSLPGSASEFGNNISSFTVHLTKAQLKTLKQSLNTKGGAGIQVGYKMSVPAQLPAVDAHLSFNSSIAYKYQVTHAHHSWGHSSPRMVRKLMQESDSTVVDIKWQMSNPPQSLRNAVTNWANATIASQLHARVQEVLAMYSESDYDSFSINQVSSFNAEYKASEVINWFIYPKATLPSFADEGWDLSQFETTVNTQQQVMTVSVDLPFNTQGKSTLKEPKSPNGIDPVEVDNVVVTVDYPGIDPAHKSHTFTANGSFTFLTDYNVAHGSDWNLSWEVSYKGGVSKVAGAQANINETNFNLQVPQVGILTVQFDASNAFNPPQGQTHDELEEIYVKFSFVDSEGLGTPVTQTLIFSAPPSSSGSTSTPKKNDLIQQVSSFIAYPINNEYNWTPHYHFKSGAISVGKTVTGNGFNQHVPAPAYPHPTNVILAFQQSSSAPPIINATVDIWFDGDPGVANVGTYPTKDSPTTYTLTPKKVGASSWYYESETFYAYINGKAPLGYQASITSAAGQTNVPETMVENTQPTILINTKQRYFTLEFNMAAVDWKTVAFREIQVQLEITDGSGTSAVKTNQNLQWNQNETENQYITVGMSAADAHISYKYTISYVTPGQSPVPKKSGSGNNGNASGNKVIDIPAKPS